MPDVFKDVGLFFLNVVALLLGLLLIGTIYFSLALLLLAGLALIAVILPSSMGSEMIPWMPHDAIVGLFAVLFLYWQFFGFILPALKAVFMSIWRNDKEVHVFRRTFCAVLRQAKLALVRFNHFRVAENGN